MEVIKEILDSSIMNGGCGNLTNSAPGTTIQNSTYQYGMDLLVLVLVLMQWKSKLLGLCWWWNWSSAVAK